MNRITVSLIVLTAMGGCMGLDPVDDSSCGNPNRSPAQSQAWPMTSQGAYRGTDGRSVQSAYGDWNTQPATPQAKAPTPLPQNTASVKKSTPNSTTTTTASTKSSSSKPAVKTEGALVMATYSETKGSDTSASAMSKASPKSPAVNLGVLRLLNSKRVTFHYEVKDPSSSGAANLELWGTTDTRSWKKYDIVKQTPKSVVTDVKDEGLYGFTMIAHGKNDVTRNQPPLPGEPPQVWVAVDMTKPVVQLLGVELNVISQTPTLVVRWDAKDRNLGPRPITLLYAERLEGPWTPMAANVENSGRYEWAMPAYVPSNVYVRVQATDVMGNLGMAQTTTLHLPGRSSNGGIRGEPALTEPGRLGLTPPNIDAHVRPLAATVNNPAVSIMSVDGDE
jgi:hypothetical protein